MNDIIFSFSSVVGKKKVLHEVCGKFPPNKLIAIMGPSGAGKSTLLDLISGYRFVESFLISLHSAHNLSEQNMRRKVGQLIVIIYLSDIFLMKNFWKIITHVVLFHFVNWVCRIMASWGLFFVNLYQYCVVHILKFEIFRFIQLFFSVSSKELRLRTNASLS